MNFLNELCEYIAGACRKLVVGDPGGLRWFTSKASLWQLRRRESDVYGFELRKGISILK